MKRLALLVGILTLAASGTVQTQSDGEKVGTVNQMDWKLGEVIVGSSTASKDIMMGDLLYVRIDGKIVQLRATFPMQSLAKCKSEGKNRALWTKAEKGMPVYRYKPGIVDTGRAQEIAGGPGKMSSFSGIDMIMIPGKGKISRFFLGKYEVTQKQYEEIMGSNPSGFVGKPNNPVEQVSWYDAVEFCNMLSQRSGYRPYYKIDKEKKDPDSRNLYDKTKWKVTINRGSNGFRLPTSEEWEYAYCAGATTINFWGEGVEYTEVNDYAVYKDNSKNLKRSVTDYGTHGVGTKKPNAFGVYDISGNVWEWCFDWHPNYFGHYRVRRGGSWSSDVDNLGLLSIECSYPYNKYDDMGIRLARTP